MAVDRKDADAAVRGIHEAFGLDRLDTGEDTTRRFDLAIQGFGRIGQALARLVVARRDHFRERFGLEVRIVGLADRGATCSIRAASPRTP